jgi:hypothetical protein
MQISCRTAVDLRPTIADAESLPDSDVPSTTMMQEGARRVINEKIPRCSRSGVLSCRQELMTRLGRLA